ncbi:LOW QUALITY PROTEIN: vam6/Vps39-like protein [Sycon ciliatum]|uniref:LOW QUALITY PROTEIN: vam6/Vps39-like protein n=1 Tax=Sycon ciliatum TaxID=27933 RepID=UPI0031F63719
MHDAFEAVVAIEKLPLHIECIATWESSLFVGTRTGVLLVYSIKEGGGGSDGSNLEVELKRPMKSFSKKPIVQLDVVGALGIFIALSDGVIGIYDLETCSPRGQLQKSRGANCFAVHVQGSGKSQNVLLCVSVKRHLEVHQWNSREGQFVPLGSDLNVPDTAKALAWCGDSICVGFKREYTMVKVTGGALTELFGTGRHDPVIVALGPHDIALGKDEMSICINHEGKPTQKQALVWSDPPFALESVEPYVVGLLPKVVEVRTMEPRMLVQSFSLDKARFICSGRDIYIASEHRVWRLQPVELVAQIAQLVQDKQFDLALNLAKRVQESRRDNRERIAEVRHLQAFHMFTQHRFEECLSIYSDLNTDVKYVIGLFPGLLPNEFRKTLKYPAAPPVLVGSELDKGLGFLADYLKGKRNALSKQTKETPATDEQKRAHEEILHVWEVIDSTLLKCYLKINDALVRPLLRLKDNCCHLVECERVLQNREKYEELVQLYQNKENHKKALDLLLRHGQKSSGTLRGYEPTIRYLQHLGANRLELIFEYSKWILRASPEDGLRIFTEDSPEVESLPRDKVLAHLESVAKSLVIKYLEHIIIYGQDTSAVFHNRLITLYRERIEAILMEKTAAGGAESPDEADKVPAGSEPGDLGHYRQRLLTFLEQSQHYQPAKLIVHFPVGKLFEERALLLGRMNRHEQALAIYTHVLKDTKQAEEYCRKNYNRSSEHSKDVYLCLLRMYLQPPQASSLGVSSDTIPQANVTAALEVLLEHYEHIDTAKALELLPADIPIREIHQFLCHVLIKQTQRRRDQQMLKSLLLAELLEVQQQRIAVQSQFARITQETTCEVCRKRINQSAFARYPDGSVEHFYCYQAKHKEQKES